jgi:DNA-binding GntR family transcriptional regulator
MVIVGSLSFRWVGTASTCEIEAAPIGKAGHDDGRSHERPPEAPDAVGCDRRPAQAGDSRRTYPAGSQLRQDALGDAYGVSRIPVREALFQLEAEGLVRIVPQKGAIVSELSLDEINDVFDLRGIMEPRLLAQSAPHFTERRLCRAGRHPEALREGDQGGQHQRVGPAQCRLSIWRCTFTRGGPRTKAIVIALLQTSDRYTRLQLSNTKAMGTAEKEHAHLIALCRAQQIDEACRFLAQHIEAVRTDLLQVVVAVGSIAISE